MKRSVQLKKSGRMTKTKTIHKSMWIEWNANDKLERSPDACNDRSLNDEHNAYYTCEGYWSEVWFEKLNMTEVDEGTWSEKNNRGGCRSMWPVILNQDCWRCLIKSKAKILGEVERCSCSLYGSTIVKSNAYHRKNE